MYGDKLTQEEIDEAFDCLNEEQSMGQNVASPGRAEEIVRHGCSFGYDTPKVNLIVAMWRSSN
jgi:hypothetical protein